VIQLVRPGEDIDESPDSTTGRRAQWSGNDDQGCKITVEHEFCCASVSLTGDKN
jgi:hypothetical protein